MGLMHASCVSLAGRAVLISGPPGSGKSDLALRLIDGGAVLLADDYTLVAGRGGAVIATPPPEIAGKIEVRGVGLVKMPCAEKAPLALVVELVGKGEEERLPDRRTATIEKTEVPVLALWPFAASAVAKVKLALAQVADGGSEDE